MALNIERGWKFEKTKKMTSNVKEVSGDGTDKYFWIISLFYFLI